MAPTSSFWDCGEFIACANELEVPHPPGAPFFLILGRFFALFAPSPESVAFMVNMVSVLSSAFCVMFIFWTVTHLAKKMVAPSDRNPQGQDLIVIMLSGLVAALTTTFADSFWFNAVEAEVYALSSFFTAAVVWLIFKWEARSEEADNMKWIVLIAFVMGMSIGAHLLNLLTIPALAFVYYFKKYDITPRGIAATFGISVFLLAVIQYGLIQQSVEIAWGFEKFFTGIEQMDTAGSVYNVSGMGLPMGTGILVFLGISLGLLGATLYVTHNRELSEIAFEGKKAAASMPQRVLAGAVEWTFGLPFTLYRLIANGGKYDGRTRGIINTVAWSTAVIIIGYSSYAMIVIRAQAGTPINENDPSSVASMISYLKREQYGDRPLFRGVRFNNARNQKVLQERRAFVNLSEPRQLPDGAYNLEDGNQITVKSGKITSNYNVPSANDGDNFATSLKDGRKVAIAKDKGITRIEDRYVWNGYKQDVEYTKGHVFFPRMHSGQANHYKGEFGYGAYVDRKGPTESPFDDKPTMGEDVKFFLDYQVRHMYLRYFMWNFAGREGDVQDMGWESGFEFGKLAALPDEMRDHPGKNHYFLLPLLLGLFGMVYHFIKLPKDATSIMLLFFFTGLAIIIYLNQTPYQPRERDYSYAGSFQTFAMWVGLAVVGLYDLLKEYLKGVSGYVSGALCLIAPVIMGVQNWDDHSRAL
ncbi:MAG: DUF2723 domain-containing protein, partial [Bacteroidota bacterium]